MPDSSKADAPSAIAAGLARLWVKFLPEVEGRQMLLESAVASLQGGTLDAEQRNAAHSAAHKLAGILGTFGLQRGTDLARKLENSFGDGQQLGESIDDLNDWVRELSLLIEDRKR